MSVDSNDPLLPHLLDIASDPASCGLILAGGYSIRLKQADIRQIGARTLIEVVPPARATQDLDFSLNIAMFQVATDGKAIRALLDRLGYSVVARKENLQFTKLSDSGEPDGPLMKVDLLARTPREDEGGVRVKPGRLSRVGSGSGTGLHGRETPEAFAIDDMPQVLRLSGRKTDGMQVVVDVCIPHPYTSINMKVKAAHDWLRMMSGEIPVVPHSEKHTQDVYTLVAMLTARELQESQEISQKYATNPIAMDNRRNIVDLYGSRDAKGFLEVRLQSSAIQVDYDTFWEGLRSVLGP